MPNEDVSIGIVKKIPKLSYDGKDMDVNLYFKVETTRFVSFKPIPDTFEKVNNSKC